MSFTRKKHSEETKAKISLSKIGSIPWNKGLKGYLAGSKHYHFSHGLSQTKEYKQEIQKKWIEKNRSYKNFLSLQRHTQVLNTLGSHTFDEWEVLKSRFDFMCLCCKRKEPEIVLSQDHIVPISKGGSDNIENIQPLCRSCNSRKHAKNVDYISLYQIKQN